MFSFLHWAARWPISDEKVKLIFQFYIFDDIDIGNIAI